MSSPGTCDSVGWRSPGCIIAGIVIGIIGLILVGICLSLCCCTGNFPSEPRATASQQRRRRQAPPHILPTHIDASAGGPIGLPSGPTIVHYPAAPHAPIPSLVVGVSVAVSVPAMSYPPQSSVPSQVTHNIEHPDPTSTASRKNTKEEIIEMTIPPGYTSKSETTIKPPSAAASKSPHPLEDETSPTQ